MKLQDVIDRALTDEDFAAELKQKALAGQQAGRGTTDWGAFVEYFADGPDQLANFTTLTDPNDPECTLTTCLLLNAVSTVNCTLTTTTMTASIFCGENSAQAE
jgi:hypothetical protein